MIKFVVDMHILGRGGALAIVEAYTIPEARATVHVTAAANNIRVLITEIIPWADFVIQESGFDLISTG